MALDDLSKTAPRHTTHPSPLDMRYHIMNAIWDAFPEGETEHVFRAQAAVRKGFADAFAEHDALKVETGEIK